MKQEDLINCGICILIGFLLYSFIQNGLCSKKDLFEGFCWTQWGPKNVGEPCETKSDCNCWTGKTMSCLWEDIPKDNPCYATCVDGSNWDTTLEYIRGGDEKEPEPGPGGGCGLPDWGK